MTKPKPKAPGLDETVITTKQAAELLGLESSRRVQQLVQDGHIERISPGRFTVQAVVSGYLQFLRDERKDQSRQTSESRLRDAKTRGEEIRNARADHELVELAEAEAVLDEAVGMLKSELSGVPAAVTRDLELRRTIEAQIDGAFGRTHARIGKALAALGESGEAVEADPEA